MSITAARRRFGSLVAVAVAALPALAQPLPAAASSTGTLFALVGPSPAVARLDPATGSLTTIADLSVPPGQRAFFGVSMAIDAGTHRLFLTRVVYSDINFTFVLNQLVTVNTQTGGTQVSPDMGEGVSDLVFDTSSQTLYGHTNDCCPFHVVRIDPVTGALTPVAALPGVQQSFIAIASATHSIYMASEAFVLGQFQPVNTMLTLDPATGSIFESPPMNTGIFALLYDTSSGTIFGKSFCCPMHLMRVNPATGAETAVGSFDMGLSSALTIDPSSHTIFEAIATVGAFGMTTDIVSINDQTGAAVVDSTIPSGTNLFGLAFEPAAITPDSIRADVRSALSSGAIDNAGVANALLAQRRGSSPRGGPLCRRGQHLHLVHQPRECPERPPRRCGDGCPAKERGSVPHHQLPIGRDPCPSMEHAAVSVSLSRSRSRSCRRHHNR
jgi:hypothetical protein